MADTGMTLGKAYVQIMPSAEGIKGKLENVLGGEMPAAGKSAGNSLGQSLVGTLKGVIAAAGIGAALKASISEGMELEQNLGGTEAVFGDFADNIKTAAADAYKSMGMSASEYMATANKMGSLFQGSGLEQQQALDLTAQAMQRAADVASVMGIDTSMAMESIAGAAKGNFTMMDNLGVAMNATTLQAYALEKGVNFEWNTASNAEKAQLAMQMFMERTSQYEGNFARESEQTLSGSLGAMQSAFKNVLGNLAVGADVVPAMQSLVDTACSFLVSNLLPAVGNILSGLPDIVGTLAQGIQAKLPDLLPMAGEAVGSLVSGIMENLPRLAEGAGEIITSFAGFIDENLPGILESGIGFLRNFVEGILSGLPDFLAQLPQIISSFLEFIARNLPQILQAGWDMLTTLFDGILQAIPMLLDAAPEILGAVVDGIASIAGGLLDVGKNIVEGLWEGISGAAGWLADKIGGFFDGVVSGAKDLLGIHSPSRVFAGIGKNIALGLGNGIHDGQSSVGNAMKELVSTMDTKDISLGAAAQFARPADGYSLPAAYQPAAGNAVNRREVTIQSGAIVINAAPGQDAREIADAVMERINRLVVQKEAAFA